MLITIVFPFTTICENTCLVSQIIVFFIKINLRHYEHKLFQLIFNLPSWRLKIVIFVNVKSATMHVLHFHALGCCIITYMHQFQSASRCSIKTAWCINPVPVAFKKTIVTHGNCSCNCFNAWCNYAQSTCLERNLA